MEGKIEKQLVELIESVDSYLAKIPNGCLIIADFLREGDNEKGFASITDLIVGIDWLTKSFNLLKQNNYVVNIDIYKLNQILKEINDALNLKNETLLADLIEYEVADFFENAGNINIYKSSSNPNKSKEKNININLY